MEDQILLTEDEMSNLPCDTWHVHGNVSMYKNDKEAVFIEALKKKIENVELPTGIDWGGYPYLKVPALNCPESGWFLDAAKRFTAIYKGYLIFQRYTAGGPIMYGKLGNPANEIMTNELMASLLAN